MNIRLERDSMEEYMKVRLIADGEIKEVEGREVLKMISESSDCYYTETMYDIFDVEYTKYKQLKHAMRRAGLDKNTTVFQGNYIIPYVVKDGWVYYKEENGEIKREKLYTWEEY